ncbi:type II toxin-antitoxin system VapC family toxin [Pontibacter diazotrophicus]|uniref:Type II toxin-antitoxin system VapC family toxin n=1 Tax=Pontibacter diazotrophicus TaxID=1400979 RepID=A0A3D8LAD4_9BACT|nr:type II toxin-antitoxin system VapC family toxin [Pontibacter diazotrophicus]RDV14294.1 type II toxin-antitoxin system VapC family toxin [Pontibacter diazotrophicus]
MNLLLDTHAVIWFITEDEHLPASVKELIEDTAHTCFVSIASLWEMGIKHSLGKLDLKAELKEIFELIEQSGLTLLPITTAHILANTALDFHHRDPFDRLIIAQAKTEGLTLVSKDDVFVNYSIALIWGK